MGPFTLLFISYQWAEAAIEADSNGVEFSWLPKFR